jgi:hypothetical protein
MTDAQPLRPSRRFALALVTGSLVLLAAVVVVTIALLMRPAAPLQTVRLPDGSRLELMAVTYGKEHRYVEGTTLQRLLWPLGQGRWLGGTAQEEQTAAEGLVFWVRERGGPIGPNLSRWFLPSGFDEHGCEYNQQNNYVVPAPSGSPAVRAIPLFTYPRRVDWVGLRLHEQAADGTYTIVGEFRVPNPRGKPLPTWFLTPLPARQEQDGVSFELREFRTDTAPRAVSRKQKWVMVATRARDLRHPERTWNMDEARFTDAGGNTLPFNQWVREESGGVLRTYCSAAGAAEDSLPLCPAEPGWRVQLTWSRSDLRSFGPDELWRLPRLAMPRSRSAVSLNRPAAVGKSEIELAALVPPGAPLPSRIFPGSRFGHALLVRVRGEDPQSRLTLLRAVDERGRKVDVGSTTTGRQGGRTEYLFDLSPNSDAQSLDLTLAVHRARITVFTAAPQAGPAPPGPEPTP